MKLTAYSLELNKKKNSFIFSLLYEMRKFSNDFKRVPKLKKNLQHNLNKVVENLQKNFTKKLETCRKIYN